MATHDVAALSAAEQIRKLQAGEITSHAVVKACCDRIAQVEQRVGAFLSCSGPEAMAQADAVDAARKSGEKLGPLAGLPVVVKDVFCTDGFRTTCASRILESFIPPYDATVVRKLKEAGAIIVGKTNMDEFAMGGSTENSAFGETHNPWALERSPGGSSGGAAACVAASMVNLSIGTDTGGSIRQPAAFCGVTGLKPTYGRVSRYGLIAFASSLDQAGPIAWSAEDAALLMDVIAGHDPLDSTSVDVPTNSYSQSLAQSLTGLKLGIVKEHFGAGLDDEVAAAVKAAIEVYRSLGATVQEISLPHSKYAVATYYVIAPSEASGNLARYDGVHYGRRANEKEMLTVLAAERKSLEAAGDEKALRNLDTPLVRLYRQSRSEGFGPEVKRRIMLGTYALSAGYYDAYYLQAMKVRRLIRGDYDAAFEKVDLLIGPVTPTPAFKLGEKLDDPLAMYLLDIYTVSANLAGVPAISLPCGQSTGGLPIGLQLQGPTFSEDRLLRAAHMFQTSTDWHTRRPGLA
jgi:aspartyl-tRNA(Asn)/glutamyl-tRNA(Gln) amidotransferase subunit A